MSEPAAATGRVVYVLLADPGTVPPPATFARWPTAGRTLGALRRAGVDVSAVARGTAGEQHEHDGVEWTFVRDPSRGAWRIAGAVRAQRPAVVHLNGVGFAVSTLVMRVRLGRGVRIVVQHHGEPPGTGLSGWAQRLARRAVDAYLFTGGREQATPFLAARVLRADTPVHDVLESSADVEAVEQAAARRRTGMTGSPAVVSVGRLIPGKDPLTALVAFCAFAARSPGSELWWLFHDGELEGAVRAELARHPGAAGRVHLVGRVSHDEVGAWLSGADVFLSASMREGSGYALIEAIRCGCTPVVTDIAPHRAIAGSLGVRFDPGDAAGAAAALASVTADRAGAVAWFAKHLTWDRVASQLLAAYRSRDR